MPCRDWESETESERYANQQVSEIRERLDHCTQDLCFLCAQLIDDGVFTKYASPRIIAWQKRHHENDTYNIEREMQQHINNYAATVTEDNIAKHFIDRAEAVHPVSSFHKRWFHEKAKEAYAKMSAKARKRVKRDELKQQAIKKLSPAERAALGLG